MHVIICAVAMIVAVSLLLAICVIFAMYLRCVAVSKGYVFTLLCSKSSAVLPLVSVLHF